MVSVLRTPSILVAYHLPMNRILAATRYAVVVPAIASILGALLLMVQGSIEMIQVIIDAATNSTKLKITIVEVLTAVDAILLGTVLLVIGYGLYELFINEDLNVPAWLQVHDLDDLKSKLIGVVVALIAVIFVGVFVDVNRSKDVIAYGVGAGALVTGLAVFAFATKKDPATKVSRKDLRN
jgi:uncharacterized membrane protein YqhA